jgi:hypothetical protein
MIKAQAHEKIAMTGEESDVEAQPVVVGPAFDFLFEEDNTEYNEQYADYI